MDHLPVIVGVGEAFDEPKTDPLSARTPIALAADALGAALDDAGGGDGLRRAIDALFAVRIMTDSNPFMPSPFGRAANPPRAIAAQAGLQPRLCVHDIAGGQSPQRLVNEIAERLARGALTAVALAGGEAIAAMKLARRTGAAPDWNDATEGAVEDRGPGLDGLLGPIEIANHIFDIGAVYGLFEHARRARLGLSRKVYAQAMGELLAPMAATAATKAAAIQRRAQSAAEIATASADNPLIFDPYTKAMMAKDGVNQGAALIMTTAGAARRFGIAPEKLVYLHGAADLDDRTPIERTRLDASDAMTLAYRTALARAGARLDDVAAFDLYSCFPVAIFAAAGAMGITGDDKRRFSVTGGLPFFGGPGNNYSLHAIVAMADRLRAARRGFGVVGANGGFLSKHSVGVYSATAPASAFVRGDDAGLQAQLRAAPGALLEPAPLGKAIIETYSLVWRDGAPQRAIVFGRLAATGARFAATSKEGAVLARMVADDPLGAEILVHTADKGASFTI
jgi:acetyl-CoA C-acetyltransferase